MASILSDITYVLENKDSLDFSNITKELYDKIRDSMANYRSYRKYLENTKDTESLKQYYKHLSNDTSSDSAIMYTRSMYNMVDKELADFIVNNDILFNNNIGNYESRSFISSIVKYNPDFLLDKRIREELPVGVIDMFSDLDGDINVSYVFRILDIKNARLSDEFIETIKSQSSVDEIGRALLHRFPDGDLTDVSPGLIRDIKNLLDIPDESKDIPDESFINSLFDELQTRPILYSVLFTGTALVAGGLLYRKKKNKIEKSVNLISKKYDIDPKIIYFFTDIYYDFRFLIKKQLFRKKQYLEKLHTSFELFQNHIDKHPKKSKILNDIKNDEFMSEMNEHFYNKRRSSDINEKIYNLLKSKNISKGQFKSELSIESDQNIELLPDIELLLYE